MRRLILAGLIMLLSTPVFADELAVGEGLILAYTLPEGWVLHTEAPQALAIEMAEHIAHEAAAMDKHPSEDQIMRVARKRLAANEAIAYHAESGSHLAIDFSPLEDKEDPPSSKQLKQSAEFAAQSLEGEEEVSGVEFEVSSTRVRGSSDAYRLDATYRQHEKMTTFIGVIGYAARHWFFLYVTAPGQQPDALKTVEELLDSLQIKTR